MVFMKTQTLLESSNMRKVIFVVLGIFLMFKVSGQTVSKIDSIVDVIDCLMFTDSVNVEVLRNKSWKSFIGYYSKDNLKKINLITKNQDSVSFYYTDDDFRIFSKAIQNETTKRVYYFESFNLIFEEENGKQSIDTFHTINDSGDYYSFLVEEYVEDLINQKFILHGRLICIPDRIDPCGGIMLSGVAFKFEVISFDDYDTGKNVVINIPCPTIYGKNYFEVDKEYRMIVAKKCYSGSHVNIRDNYKEENLPTYWIRTIECID